MEKRCRPRSGAGHGGVDESYAWSSLTGKLGGVALGESGVAEDQHGLGFSFGLAPRIAHGGKRLASVGAGFQGR